MFFLTVVACKDMQRVNSSLFYRPFGGSQSDGTHNFES